MELEPLLRALGGSRLGGGAGIRDWSICAEEGRRIGLGVKDREVGGPHAPLRAGEWCGAGYRLIWSDGLVSRGYLERRQLEGNLEDALRQARAAAYADPDAAWVLGPAPMPEVATHHPDAARIAAGDTGLFASRLATLGRHVRELRTWSGSFNASDGTVRLVTSLGLDEATRGTSFGWHVSANGEVGDGFSTRAPESETDFEGRVERLMALSRELERPAQPVAAGVHTVLLHPDVVEEFVLETLLHNLAGSTVAHGEGHFRREQFGSEHAVLREDLSLRLDPLEPLKRGSYRFTGEGVPAAPLQIIERGRLIRPLVDLKYSRRLGLPPTPMPLGLDTLHLEGPEALTLDEALGQAAGGVFVLSVLGVHTQDAASGDFSLSAPQALRIDGGGFAGRLGGTISGNLFEVLSSAALRLVRFTGEHTPGLLLRCRLDPR